MLCFLAKATVTVVFLGHSVTSGGSAAYRQIYSNSPYLAIRLFPLLLLFNPRAIATEVRTKWSTRSRGRLLKLQNLLSDLEIGLSVSFSFIHSFLHVHSDEDPLTTPSK
ncbi:hypothetical protein B0T16DRAFT_194771 [Cercophora newfieldiana]|uniref:Uncharacterized protein n=1 Tax=Cercophora newfieldiana TaxID=92897 RepID=A0AA39Y1H4_9PEZI|nr:hypothetical protein B0T16DRAFT_194771 [Cercophora newfieldiana]